MSQNLTEWDKDVGTDAEEEYEALLRSLRWTEGFGLLFVDCSPAAGEELIEKVEEDLPRKRIEVLRLDEPIENLFELVANLPNRDRINILFVKGLEHSIYEYEKSLKDRRERLKYPVTSVPHFLARLNLQRESFRDRFNICFVFLLPKFVLTYFNRRAPDFYDWRSGVFEWGIDGELSSQELAQSEDEFWFNQGVQDYEAGNLEGAIACWEKALDVQPDYHAAWYNRGIALENLGRYQEAIASYDKALEIKPDDDAAWYNRGNALKNLGRYEEAVASYDKALEFKPDKDEAWYNKACNYALQGHIDLALENLQQAINLNPDKYRQMAKTDTDFDRIRDDERFQALLL
jgi:tetratricopeptide (TPR) repeat protein